MTTSANVILTDHDVIQEDTVSLQTHQENPQVCVRRDIANIRLVSGMREA